MRSDAKRQFYFDVFVTAIEGGISYWSSTASYHWHTGEPALEHQDLNGFNARIHDVEDEDQPYLVRRSVIMRGVAAICAAKAPFYEPNSQPMTQCADVPFLDKYTADQVRNANHSNDAGDIDAGLADAIVQVGLFGEVRYG